MGANKLEKFWLLASFLLIAIIIVSGFVIRAGLNQGQPIEIVYSQPLEFNGEILVDGAVNSPGLYPLKNEDSITDILQASGGTLDTADFSRLKLYIPQDQEGRQPQKVDINTAEAWLLESLPDIGPTRSKAIIQQRQQVGFFRSISELTSVPGISGATFEKIKNLITVTN